jgi:hypothetical protein
MKKNFLKAFAASFLMMAYISAYSQHQSYIKEGEIKTLDVKIAWVKGWKPYYECIVLSKNEPKTYLASEISGYRTTWGNPFVSYEVEADEWVFLELIETGELSLYKYIDKEFNTHYYVKQINDDSFHEINDRRGRSKRKLKELWTGCEKFKKLIDQAKYNDNSLLRLIRAHNDCNYVHIPKVRKSISIGANNISLFFSPSRGYDSAIPGGILSSIVKKVRGTSIMVDLNLSFPISDSDASFVTGLGFNKWSLYDFSFAGLGDIIYITDIDLIDVHIPLGLEYTWPKKKLRPFIIGSFAPHYIFQDNSLLSSEVFTTDGIFYEETYQDMSKWGYSGGLAIGLKYHLSSDRIIHIKFGNFTRFNMQRPHIFNVNSFYLAAGYSF